MKSFVVDCKPWGSRVGEEDFGEAVKDEASRARLGTMFENHCPPKGLAFVLVILDTMT